MGLENESELTELSDLTTNMLGSRSHKALKVKAAECWGVLNFCSEVIKNHPRLGDRGATYLVAVDSLIQHVNIMRTHGRVLPPYALQGLVDTFKTCVGALESIDFHFTPKFHTWAHIVVDARVKGDPWFAATF